MTRVRRLEIKVTACGITALTEDEGQYLIHVVKLACEVRTLQKQYFEKRDKDLLIASKAKEKELDQLLAQQDGGLI